MLEDSRLLNDLQAFAKSPFGNPYRIYGYPAYLLRIHLQAPFRYRVLTPQMMDFNRSMSSVRESVEWLFNDVTNYFKLLDFKNNLKIGLSSVGKMYVASAFLRNALTCLFGNRTSIFFLTGSSFTWRLLSVITPHLLILLLKLDHGSSKLHMLSSTEKHHLGFV